MLSEDGDKPIEKSGQRNRKAEQGTKKQRNRKSARPQSPAAAQPQQAQEQTSEPITTQTSAEISEQVSAPLSPSGESTAAEAPHVDSPAIDSPAVDDPASAETGPVSLQTIADAYGDFTRKSFEQTRSFFEQLAGARSFDKALELQTSYVRQACDTFTSEAQKIRDLHKALGKQNLERWEGLVPGMKKPG